MSEPNMKTLYAVEADWRGMGICRITCLCETPEIAWAEFEAEPANRAGKNPVIQEYHVDADLVIYRNKHGEVVS